MKIMKIKVLLTVLFLSFIAAAAPVESRPLYSPDETSRQAPKTDPSYISMLFYKMTHRLPDFNVWAQNQMGLDQAPGFMQLAERDAIAEEMRRTFELLSHAEPIYVSRLVRLPYYSLRHHGYFIDSFTPQTFFPFEHMGENFAVIPNKIENQQYIQVSEYDAALIEQALQATNTRDVRVILTLIPEYADARPVRLADGNYWPLLAEIRSISFYSTDGAQLLWDNRASPPSAASDSTNIHDLFLR